MKLILDAFLFLAKLSSYHHAEKSVECRYTLIPLNFPCVRVMPVDLTGLLIDIGGPASVRIFRLIGVSDAGLIILAGMRCLYFIWKSP